MNAISVTNCTKGINNHCNCDPTKSFTGHGSDCQDTFSLTSQKELADLKLMSKFYQCTQNEEKHDDLANMLDTFENNYRAREEKNERRELLEREQNRLVEEITLAKQAKNKDKVKRLTGQLGIVNQEIKELESELNYLEALLSDCKLSIKSLEEEAKERLESIKTEFLQAQEEAEKLSNELQTVELNNQKIKMEHQCASVASQKSTQEANSSKILLNNCKLNCEQAHVEVEERRVISQEAKAELKVAKAALEAAKASGIFTGGASLAVATAAYQAAKLKSSIANLALMASQVKEQGLKVNFLNAEMIDKGKQSIALLDLTKLKKYTDLLKSVSSISDSLKDAFNTSCILLNYTQEKKEKLEDKDDKVRLKVEDVITKEENIRVLKGGREEK
ncbi:hypothetical protein IJT10_06570 [bacterium]|nr:hypothetical protein [bacterium]